MLRIVGAMTGVGRPSLRLSTGFPIRLERRYWKDPAAAMRNTAVHVALFVFVSAAFPATNIHFNPDSVTYLRDAIRIVENLEYQRTFRGPGFAVTGAIGYAIGGPGAFSTFLLPRIGYALGLIFFFYLSRRLYGPGAALTSAAYLACAPAFFVVGSTYQIDVFVIAWSLLALWLNYTAYERASPATAVASGAVFALAFLTKEVAVLLLPVMLFGWLAFYRRLAGRVAVGLWALAAFSACLAPWFAYVWFASSPADVLGKNVNTSGKFSGFLYQATAAPIEFLLSVPQTLGRFVHMYILGWESAVPRIDLFAMGSYGVVAVACTVVVAMLALARRRAQDIYVFLIVASFAPFALYLANYPSQPRQAAIIFVALALAVPAVVAEIRNLVAEALERRRHRPDGARGAPAYARAAPIAVIVCGLVAAGVSTPTVRALFGSDVFGFGLANTRTAWFKPTGEYDPQIVAGGAWLAKQEAGGTILTAYRRNAKLLEMFFDPSRLTGAAVAKHNLQNWRTRYLRRGAGSTGMSARMGEPKWSGKAGRLLFLRLNRPGQWQDCVTGRQFERLPRHFCKIYFWTEAAMLNKIKEKNVRYVVVGDQMAFQRAYFDASEGFARVKEVSGVAATAQRGEKGELREVVIYRVDRPEPIQQFEIRASNEIPDLFNTFRRTYGDEYALWRNEVLKRTFGMTDAEIRKAETGRIACFRIVGTKSRDVPCVE